MAKMDAAERKATPKKDFGLPGKKSAKNPTGKGGYPMPDKDHARNAKARASEMEHKGKLSKDQEEKIDRKADRVLGKKTSDSKAMRDHVAKRERAKARKGC